MVPEFVSLDYSVLLGVLWSLVGDADVLVQGLSPVQVPDRQA